MTPFTNPTTATPDAAATSVNVPSRLLWKRSAGWIVFGSVSFGIDSLPT
jgi:hypothetical protein